MFFLVKGSCTVSVRDYRNGGKAKFVRNLKPSSLFGEVALLFNCKRTASVNSINYSIVARLARSKFDFICTEFPQLIEKLKQEFNNYNDPWRYFLKSVMKGVSYLQYMPQDLLNELSTMLKD